MNSSEQQLLDELRKEFPDFSCTLQDLRNPTEEFVTNFYTFWLNEFEVDIKNICQVQFSQSAVVGAYHDAYASTIPKLNLLKSIRAFNVVPDFGMLDIISPTPKRIQTILRSFLEFYVWSDTRVGSMMDLKKDKKLKERKDKRSQMIQEGQDLKETLNTVIKSIAQIQDAKKELEGVLSKNQNRAAKLSSEKEIFKSKSDEANQKIKEKEAILHKFNKEESQMISKIKELSNQIVDSPSSILCDLDTLRVRSEEANKMSDQKRDLVESKMKSQENMHKVVNSLQERSELLDDLLNIIDQQRKMLQIVSDTEKSTSDLQEKLEQLKSMLATTNKKKAIRQEALQELNLKWKEVKSQLTESVEIAIRSLNDKKNAKSKMSSELKESVAVQENIDLIMRKIKAHVGAFDRECSNLVLRDNECCERIQSHINSRMEHVRKEVKKKYKE